MNWLVGTYSKRNSNGIYRIHLNESSGEISLISSFSNVSPGNPSFLILDKKNKVYSIGESLNGDPGVVYSYNLINDKLIKINEAYTNGINPCHLSINDRNDFLVAVNYSSGDFSSYKVSLEGKLTFIEQITHSGSSINPNRQREPHAHSINFLDNYSFYVCDLGVDKIFYYKIDPDSYKIISTNFTNTKPGSGPRHFILNKYHRRAYSINELDSTINYFEIKPNNELRTLQVISTIPKDYYLETTTADLHFSSDLKYLYGSNRGHDTIAKFIINDDGTLIFDKHFSTLGKTPRNFAISKSGKFCLVANENSDDIYSFEINSKNGDLVPTGYGISIPSPVCLSEIFE
jgi:6-phosphogluconolactonase